jgi:hypothetical protein
MKLQLITAKGPANSWLRQGRLIRFPQLIRPLLANSLQSNLKSITRMKLSGQSAATATPTWLASRRSTVPHRTPMSWRISFAAAAKDRAGRAASHAAAD